MDYLFLNFSDFDSMSHFDNLDFTEHSDHAPVSFDIYLKSYMQETPLEELAEDTISRKIVWDNN